MVSTIPPIILAVVLAAWYGDEVLVRSTKVRPAKSPFGLASEHFPKVVLGLTESNNLAKSVGMLTKSGDMCADMGVPEPKSIDAKSIPSPEVLLQNLNRSIAASRADPCNAQVLLRHFHLDAGFGAKINNMVTAVVNALNQDPPLSLAFVVEKANPLYQHLWLKHFTNGLGIPTCTKPKSGMLGVPAIGRQVYLAMCNFRPINEHPAESFRLRHAILSKFFVLNAAYSRLIDSHLAALNLGEKYIGVHIRHRDKGVDAKVISSALYAGPVRTHAKKHDIKTVFVASDDPNAVATLQRALPGMTIKSAPRLAPSRYVWQAVGGDDDANLALIVDVVALWRSKIFIGTASSNMGRMIFRLRGETQKQNGISMDFKWPDT